MLVRSHFISAHISIGLTPSGKDVPESAEHNITQRPMVMNGGYKIKLRYD